MGSKVARRGRAASAKGCALVVPTLRDVPGAMVEAIRLEELPTPIRGRWLDIRYTYLRSVMWFVRNYRTVSTRDAVAMAQLVYVVRELLQAGEPLEAVIPAVVDLLERP